MSSGGYQNTTRYGGLTGSHCTLFGYLTLLGLPMCEVLKNGIAIKLAKVIAIITTPAAD